MIKRLLILVYGLLAVMRIMAADIFVNFQQGDWQLNEGQRVTIFVAPDEEQGVMIAARNLKTDIEKVCGAEVVFVNQVSEARIIAGTARKLKIHERELKGKTEQYLLDYALAAAAMKNTIIGDFNLATDDEITAVM